MDLSSNYESMVDGCEEEMKKKSSVSFLRGSKAKFVRQRPRREERRRVVVYSTRPL